MTQVSKKSNLYILVFPEKKVIKIGKANSIQGRINQLQKIWGSVDYKSSYSIEIEKKNVFKLENSLQFMLSRYSVKFEEGDGKTEFFSMDAIEQALEHIRLYLLPTGNPEALKKGIQKSIIEKKNNPQKPPDHPSKIFSDKTTECINSMDSCTANLKKLFILIKILLRYQYRIPFQYDVEDDTICFRIRYNNRSQFKLIDSVFSLFQFYMKDSFGSVSWKICSANFVDGDIFQYNLNFKKDDHPYMTYINTLIRDALYKLPQKSKAVIDNIPILDFNRTSRSIIASWNA